MPKAQMNMFQLRLGLDVLWDQKKTVSEEIMPRQ